jgi:hypothetical protein
MLLKRNSITTIRCGRGIDPWEWGALPGWALVGDGLQRLTFQ